MEFASTAWEENKTASLFPAYSVDPSDGGEHKGTKVSVEDKDLNWLENSSFSSQASKKLLEIHTLLKQTAESDIVRAEDSSASIHSTTKKRKRQRRLKEGRLDHKRKKGRRHDEDLRTQAETEKEQERKEDSSIQTSTVFTSRTKIFLDDFRDLEPKDAFRVDRAPDANNLTLNNLCKNEQSKYHRIFNWSLSAGHSRGCSLEKVHKKSSGGRYFSKDSRDLVNATVAKRTLTHSSSTPLASSDESVVLLDPQATSTVPYRDVGNMQSLGIYDASTQLYLEGKAPPSKIEHESVERDIFRDNTAEYNRQLHENEHNVDLWLDFVKFQDTCNMDSRSSSRRQTVITEKKLSILDRALQANPNSVALKIAKINLNIGIMDSEMMSNEWEKLLFVHSGNGEAWKSYLLFIQSQLSMFGVTKVSEAYHRCLKTMTAIIDGSVQSVDVSENLSQDRLDIFEQYCNLLRQTDYSERALASYQALIEFNLFAPPQASSLSLEERRVMFDSLWDSNVAVFGECGALGWAYWHQQQAPEPQFSHDNDDTEEKERQIIREAGSRSEAWHALETLRSQRHLMRWRPDISRNETEDDCEDSERLVLVDDITPVLFVIDETQHFYLVVSFLRFLRVTLPSPMFEQSVSTFNIDEGYQVDMLSDLDIGICNNTVRFTTTKCELIRNVLNQAIAHFKSHEKVTLVRCLFEFEYSVVTNNGQKKDDGIDKREVKHLRRMTKSLMKEPNNRNCVTLWIDYAELEKRLGYKIEAETVVKTVIGSQSKSWFMSKDIKDRCERFALFWFYVKLLLGFCDKNLAMTGTKTCDQNPSKRNEAQAVLVCLSKGDGVIPAASRCLGPIEVLQTKHKFHKILQDLIHDFSSLSDGDIEMWFRSVTVLVDSLAVFEYLTADIESATSVYVTVIKEHVKMIRTYEQKFSKANKSNKLDISYLLNRSFLASQINLICYHMIHYPTPLAKLREPLQSALKQFPENSYFLRVFVDLEMRSFIAGRLRRYFDETIRDRASPILVLFCVASEMQRLNRRITQTSVDKTDSGTVHRLRSVFDRALDSDSCKHCILLWRLYTQFELKLGDSVRALGIFYRSLQQCPWAKILYKEAIHFCPEKIEEISDLMIEKELRLRAPLEEVDLLMAELGQ